MSDPPLIASLPLGLITVNALPTRHRVALRFGRHGRTRLRNVHVLPVDRLVTRHLWVPFYHATRVTDRPDRGDVNLAVWNRGRGAFRRRANCSGEFRPRRRLRSGPAMD